MAYPEQTFAHVFGDQSYDFLGLLRRLGHDNSDAVVSEFLDGSAVVLKKDDISTAAGPAGAMPTLFGHRRLGVAI